MRTILLEYHLEYCPWVDILRNAKYLIKLPEDAGKLDDRKKYLDDRYPSASDVPYGTYIDVKPVRSPKPRSVQKSKSDDADTEQKRIQDDFCGSS